MRWRSRAALRLPGRELQSPADQPAMGLWGPSGSLPACWVDPSWRRTDHPDGLSLLVWPLHQTGSYVPEAKLDSEPRVGGDAGAVLALRVYSRGDRVGSPLLGFLCITRLSALD